MPSPQPPSANQPGPDPTGPEPSGEVEATPAIPAPTVPGPERVPPVTIDPGVALCDPAAGLRLLAAAKDLLGPCADLARDPGAEPRARVAAQGFCWALVRAGDDGAEDDRIERACAGVREMLLLGEAAPDAAAADVLAAREAFARLARWLEAGGENAPAAGLPPDLHGAARNLVAAYFDLIGCVEGVLGRGSDLN